MNSDPKLIKNQAAKTTKTVVIVTVIVLFSETMGFLRDVLIAYRYGTGILSDTYFAVAGITILLFNLIVNSVITTVIPILSHVETEHGKKQKVAYTGKILLLIGLTTLVLAVLTEVFAPFLIRLIATGFGSMQFNLAVKLLRIGIPGIIFSGMVGVLSGFLQSEGKYYASSSTRIIFNLTCILYLFFFSTRFGILGLMGAAVTGSMLQFLILCKDLSLTGFSYRSLFKTKNIWRSLSKDLYLKRVLKLSLPVFVGVAIYDLNTMLDRTFASFLSVGNISQLTYANKIETLVISIFITGLMTVAYPEISQKVADQDLPGFKTVFQRVINLSLLITIPASIGLIILGQPIVQILYQRGEFSVQATEITARVLAMYAVGLLGKSIREVTVRAFYAFERNKVVLLNSGATLLLNILLNFSVIRFAKVELLALMTSIAITSTTIIMLFQLKRKTGQLGLKNILLCSFKSLLATVVMAIITIHTYKALLGKIDSESNLQVFLILALTIILAVIVYVVLIYLLKVKEAREIIDNILRKKKYPTRLC
ncbi:MAG: murein biosynthesis integral membrane protein MurJ [Clostridiaceae bacterium]|nr:murein biosynthesis integral membrane protein MurJ [Clostridiaceae bacterium]